MSEECPDCGASLAQYESGLCVQCIIDLDEQEQIASEVKEGNEGREECESVVIPVIPGDDEADDIVDKLMSKAKSGEREPDRMTHEGREYYRLADGTDVVRGDLYAGCLSPRLSNAFHCGGATYGGWYWRPVELDAGQALELLGKALDESDTKLTITHRTGCYCPDCVAAEFRAKRPVTIPKDLAKLVLAELSPQWHTKAVRELLRTIEEQL